MFKTIEECRLDLIGYTQMKDIPVYDTGEGEGIFLGEKPANVDLMPCSAARVSFGNEDKTGNNPDADRKLMRYLADHQHMTPFEYQHAVFLIECPLFIRSQIMRHRTFSYNEISRRYTSENLEFWIPTTVRSQSVSNRQASAGDLADQDGPKEEYRRIASVGLSYYQALLEYGVAREQARAILPQSLLTRFYMGGVLRNWAHFIELRRDEHAQYEVQVIASRVADKLRELWPESCAALNI